MHTNLVSEYSLTMSSGRDRLLATALKLFSAKGYAATSVAHIQQAAGLAPGSGALYKHFGSKRELLEAAVSHRIDAIVSAREQYDAGNPKSVEEAVRSAGQLIWTNLTQNPVTVQLIHRLLAWTLLAGGLLVWRILAREQHPREGLLLGGAVLLQFGLGVLTILGFPAHPVFWGAIHQAGAVVLLTATVLALHVVRRAIPIDDYRLTIDNYVSGTPEKRKLVPEPAE